LESLRIAIGRIIACSPERHDRSTVAQFQIGLLVRLLFSCLIDGDRIDSADFENPRAAQARLRGDYVSWQVLIQRLELHLAALTPRHSIDNIRNDISRHCRDAAMRNKGLFTLSVPTGGGKTLASLRFALHHANQHGMDRVVYVIPFTSIIDQNADVVRDILEPPGRPEGPVQIVLEHHSNLTREQQTWRDKMLTNNWDAPVVYTTSVQFLEALFGSGTRGARRMHQLANAVIVFDEIQTLPIRCVHMFNNAVNFLVEQCGSTVVLCTATQPLLDKVDRKKGAITLTDGSEMMPNVQALFDSLKRVEVTDRRKPGGWGASEIATLAQEQTEDSGSCLVIVNTKKVAKAIYRALGPTEALPVFHLSTSMCPVHRREILEKMRGGLARGDRVLCVSTQLIEAGVDVDFGSVIRCLAGLDSIAQAAGRCNRNGARMKGFVSVVNPTSELENLQSLTDICIGRDNAERIIAEYHAQPGEFDGDLIGPKAMASYYGYYFFRRSDDMVYKVSSDRIGRDDTLLNLLSTNSLAESDYVRGKQRKPEIYLRQSFMTAAKAFQAIDAPTQGVVVPYGKQGRDIVNELCSTSELEKRYELLRRAQQYTVNVFPNVFKSLSESRALNEVQEDVGVYYLNERYYSSDFGLATEPVADEELAYV
jgi:CRISPR-associated endonuclease/helicase Cas3